MEFYKQFLQSKGAPAGAGPGMHLTIFGKHPGWDDHIPDVGVTTETLSILKRDFYVRGIGGLIDAGTWDNMQEVDVLEGFNHLFVAQRGGEGIIGRMWASSDGKGRARYPMVAAIHSVNLPLRKSLPKLLWILEKLREDCISKTTEEDVLQIVNSNQEQLNSLTSELPTNNEGFKPSLRLLNRMISSEGLDDSVRHLRLLYEIKNKLEPFSPSNVEKLLPEETVPGEHIRLPYGSEMDEAEMFSAWLTYLRTQVSPRIPIFIAKPVVGEWMDAIVGHLDGKELLCLRSALHHIPCVTDLQYNISEEFKDSVEPQLTSISEWEQFPHEQSVFGVPPRRRGLDSSLATGDDETGGLKKSPLKWVLLIVFIAAIAIGAWFFFTRSKEPEPVLVEPTVSKVEDVEVSKEFDPNPEQAFAYLSDAENLWYPRLLRYARNSSVKDAWSRDQDLNSLLNFLNSQELRSKLEQVGIISGISQNDLVGMESDKKAAIVQLSKSIHSIEESLGNWKASQDLDQIRSFLSEVNAVSSLKEIDERLPPLEFERVLGDQIQNRLNSADYLDDARERIDQYKNSTQIISQQTLNSLSIVLEWCDKRIEGSTSLQELLDNISSLQRSLDQLTELLKEEPFAEESMLVLDSRYVSIGNGASEQFNLLIELYRDYKPLTGEDVPRLDLEQAYSMPDLEDDLETVRKLDPDFVSDPFLDRWKVVQSKFDSIAKIPAIRMNIDNIRSNSGEAMKLLDSLRLDVGKALAERSDPSGWYTALGLMVYGDDAFNEAWKRRVEKTVPQSMVSSLQEDNVAFIKKRQEMESWRRNFEESLKLKDSLRFPQLAENTSASANKRNNWIRDFHSILISESLAGFLDNLDIPFEGPTEEWSSLNEWKVEFDENVTDHFLSLESELSVLESDLHSIGEGAFPGLAERVQEVWSFEILEESALGLLEGLADLDAVNASTSSKDLISYLNTTAWDGLRWAAWRRLVSMENWPIESTDLDQLKRVASVLLESGLSQESLTQQLQSLWGKALLTQVDRSKRGDLWAYHATSGWDFGLLPQSWQYDRLVYLSLDPSILKKSREEVVTLRDGFIRNVNALAGVSSSIAVNGFLQELESLGFEQGRRIDRELLVGAGPGANGWQLVEADPEGKWVVYSWKSENLRFDEGVDDYMLTFVLVESPDLERFYLGSDEISVGAFFDWISESVDWNNFSHTFPESAFGSDSLQKDIAWRTGPRAWTLGTDRELYVPANWQIQSNTAEVPVLGDFKERPNRFSPITYITPETARAWAETINCRIPSTKEFTGLSSLAITNQARPNLRDSSWAMHWTFIKEKLGQHHSSWPDQDSFIPSGTKISNGIEAKAANSSNDDLLWFADVGNHLEGAAVIENLMGNVAEYFYDSEKDSYSVGGGSALSPSEVIWDSLYELDKNPTIGFSDVGFRIAFDAPTPLPGRILLDALSNAPGIELEK